MTLNHQDFDPEKAAVIAELQQTGIKHTPDKIVRIGKTIDRKIVFLEEGDANSGLQHILSKADQFAKQGISLNEIADAVMTAVTEGQIVGYQGSNERPRSIYQFTLKGEIKYMTVSVADNGYIVGANPRSKL